MPDHVFARSAAVLLLFVSPMSMDDGEHIVEPGETLAGIASRYEASLSDIAGANDIADINSIYAGVRLVIPQMGGTNTVHVVKSGETLSTIAVQYGTSVRAIADANEIPDIDLIRSGAQLSLAAGVASATSTPAESGLPTSPAGGVGPSAASQAEVVVGGSSVYEVASGDSLGDIGARLGVSSRAIVELNGITDPSHIWVGQKLTVPGGGFVCPVPNPWYHNDWGAWRSGGRSHVGTDLFAGQGAPVYAPVGGTVEQINGSLGGLQFWLHGNDGVRYIGSHLSELGVGGQVSAGDILGYIGTTGNAKGTAPHLHFEIMVDGFTVNPYYTLRAHGC